MRPVLWRPHARISILLVLLTLGLGAQQTRVVVGPPPPDAVAATGTAAITGAVVDTVTNRPVSGAVVTLEERRPRERRRSYARVATRTGRFAFLDLPASDWYFITASKPGYLDGGYRRVDPRGPGAPIALADGRWLPDVRVTLGRPGSISGLVLDERSEPVVGAYVRVLPEVPVAGRTQWLAGPVAQTDDRGAYRIAGLGPGRYVVSVPSVQATLPAGANIRSPSGSAGTSMADLAAAREAAREEKLLVDAGGRQRLVVGRHAIPPPPAPDGRRMAYPITFFPNVARPEDATAVELGPGQDRTGVDIRLQPARTSRVSGRLLGPAEEVGNQLLRLVPIGLEELGQGSEAATTVTLADGRFDFVDVPIGSYLLELRHTLLELTYASVSEPSTAVPAPVAFPASRASARSVPAAPPGVSLSSLATDADASYWARMPVTVSEADIDDFDLPLRRTVTMNGRIAWSPGAETTQRVPPLVLEPADGRRSLGMPAAVPVRPGSGGPPPAGTPIEFVATGLLPGAYILRPLFSSTAIESVTWNGRDYTERRFDTSSGTDISGVVVTLTTASSSISGIVSDATAQTAGAAVIAFPTDQEGWSNYGFSPRRLRSVLATTEGGYRIDGLPVGEYYLLAVPALQERAWLDSGFLATHVGRATRVRVDRPDATLVNVVLRVVR